MTVITLDPVELENRVKEMYRQVAEEPDGTFHFEMGRQLAARIGYKTADLDQIPAASVDSFAGVGYHFDLADLRSGESVLDLGSGSGMDTFVASLYVKKEGRVVGVDMTAAQRFKAERLRQAGGFSQISYAAGNLKHLPFENDAFDVVISNGVINLCEDKEQAFREAARVLRRGGRLAISDIVTEVQLPESITCNASLWAACIGGAMQQDAYRSAVEAAGMSVKQFYDNPEYGFISKSAGGAAKKYGVKSISLLAEKN